MKKIQFELQAENCYTRIRNMLKNVFMYHFIHDFSDGFVFYVTPQVLTLENGLSISIIIQKKDSGDDNVMGIIVSPEALESMWKASDNQKASVGLRKIQELSDKYNLNFKQIS